MSHGFTPGTKVHVEFDGEVVRSNYIKDHRLNPEFWVEVAEATSRVHHLVWHSKTLVVPVIFRLEPESWPPVPGDIWESGNGRRFFVHLEGARTVYVNELTGYGIHPADLRASSPKLVYRRGQE